MEKLLYVIEVKGGFVGACGKLAPTVKEAARFLNPSEAALERLTEARELCKNGAKVYPLK